MRSQRLSVKMQVAAKFRLQVCPYLLVVFVPLVADILSTGQSASAEADRLCTRLLFPNSEYPHRANYGK